MMIDRLAAKTPVAIQLPIGAEDRFIGVVDLCLLYTSDAADERSSVDLGGRRIIKKNTNTNDDTRPSIDTKETSTHRETN